MSKKIYKKNQITLANQRVKQIIKIFHNKGILYGVLVILTLIITTAFEYPALFGIVFTGISDVFNKSDKPSSLGIGTQKLIVNGNNNTINANGVDQAIVTGPIKEKKSLPSITSDIAADCAGGNFTDHIDEWDMSLYHPSPLQGYYVSNQLPSKSYLFPPLINQKIISPFFRSFKLFYEVEDQDSTSTQSASLYIGLRDSFKHDVAILRINAPEPNRKLIEIDTYNNSDVNSNPAPHSFQLPISMARINGENTITITPTGNPNKNRISYNLHFDYLDIKGVEQHIDIPIDTYFPTTNMTYKTYQFLIGTNAYAMIRPITYSICDE